MRRARRSRPRRDRPELGSRADNPRDQYTVEAFYRYDVTDFLQLTPQIQYVVNPANDPATDDILVVGLRLRAFF
ncbi:MAG: carbohydrate porin [Rhodobacteraceae bacterium]|nr:carbohydrate porin [Paracoccaceae bacterium]